MKKSWSKPSVYILFFQATLSSVFAQDHFSSNQAMVKLVQTEREVLKKAEELLALKQKHLDELKLAVERQKTRLISEEDIGHPVHQFQIIRRSLNDLRDLAGQFDEMNNKTLNIDNFDLPTQEDFTGAIDGLLRVQDTYGLKSLDIARGHFGSLETRNQTWTLPKLTSQNCFEIGYQAYSQKDFYHAALWMNSAWNLVQAGDETADGLQILDYLAYSISQEGNHEQARNITLLLHENYPENTRYIDNIKYYDELESVIHRPSSSSEVSYETLQASETDLTRPPPPYPEKEIYERLCREPTVYPDEIRPQLKCFYWHGKHWDSAMVWAPIKTEILYPDPMVVQFYDIISDDESERIRQFAARQLKRATIRDPQTGLLRTAEYRIQKTTWLTEDITEDKDRVVARFNKRISDITGLDFETAELLQMGNYGVGGQYEPHWDHQAYPGSKNQWEDRLGSRIATWLTYLSVPELGGKTCFLDLEIAAEPIKNSAVFWYNHKPSGDSDDKTRHAACPVVVGAKWVSNKWIHERGQELKGRKCAIDRYQTNNYL